MSSKGTSAGLDRIAALGELENLLAYLRYLESSSRTRGDPSSVHLTRALESAERLRDYVESKHSKRIDWTKVVKAIAFITDLVIKLWE